MYRLGMWCRLAFWLERQFPYGIAFLPSRALSNKQRVSAAGKCQPIWLHGFRSQCIDHGTDLISERIVMVRPEPFHKSGKRFCGGAL